MNDKQEAERYSTDRANNPYAEYTSAQANAAEQMRRAFLAGVKWARENSADGEEFETHPGDCLCDDCERARHVPRRRK